MFKLIKMDVWVLSDCLEKPLLMSFFEALEDKIIDLGSQAKIDYFQIAWHIFPMETLFWPTYIFMGNVMPLYSYVYDFHVMQQLHFHGNTSS